MLKFVIFGVCGVNLFFLIYKEGNTCCLLTPKTWFCFTVSFVFLFSSCTLLSMLQGFKMFEINFHITQPLAPWFLKKKWHCLFIWTLNQADRKVTILFWGITLLRDHFSKRKAVHNYSIELKRLVTKTLFKLVTFICVDRLFAIAGMKSVHSRSFISFFLSV